jgi:cell division protein ZipA
VLFSVASATEPGAFDLKRLGMQFIPGITIFMIPAMVSEPKKAFDALVRTAKQLAFSLNGELRDQHHNPLTLQIIDKYKHSIEVYSN